MAWLNRKTAPRVVGGRPMRKNRHFTTRGLIDPTRNYPIIARERPGQGYRHVLAQKHLYAFIDLIPDWPALSQELNAVVLAAGDDFLDGRIYRSVIYLCAWQKGLHRELSLPYFREHEDIFERLNVPCEKIDEWRVYCRFDEKSARAYQLLHIFLHELGHHHDRMTTRTRRSSARGEDYAESFARERERMVWDAYLRVSGL